MLMDEIFSFIDSANSQKMAQSFSGILETGTVILTDNSGKVRDFVDFEKVWVAEKMNGITTLKEGN